MLIPYHLSVHNSSATTTPPRRTTSSRLSPPPPPSSGRKISRDRDPPNILPLDFTPAPLNPFNIQVYRGGRVKDDEGIHWLDTLMIVVPFESEKDVEGGRTSLSIDTEHGTLPNPAENGYGSKYLLLTRPVFSQAMLDTMSASLQTVYDNDIFDYYDDNQIGVTKDDVIFARDTSIKICNVAHAQGMDEKTKQPKLETYRLKVPCDPNTGEQIYLHAFCLQGVTWNSRHDGASGDLRGFPNIAPYTDNSPLSLANKPYTRIAGYLFYKVVMYGNEEKDLHRLMATPKTTPKKVINRLQATMNAKAEQDQANAWANSHNPTTSSTTHHHRNHATTESHNHIPPRTHTTRTHHTRQTGTQRERTTTPQERNTTQQEKRYDPFDTNENDHTTSQQYHDHYAYTPKDDVENGGGGNYKNYDDDEHLISFASQSQMDEESEEQKKPPAFNFPWARSGTTDGMGGGYYDGYANGNYRG